MNSIPISSVINVVPGVLSPGGAALALNGLILTNNTRVPIGAPISFPSAVAVSNYFGPNSTEAALAAIYFRGWDQADQYPGLLYFYQYVSGSPVSAYLRGTSLATLTLTQLQALSGSLSVTIDGTVKTASSINLSAATSFSNAATIIATALSLSGGQTCTFDSISSAFVITSGTTGTGSTLSLGTGTIAAGIGLAAGTLSQGAAISTPAGAMAAITNVLQNFVCFTTAFEPVLADKLAFAIWANGTGNQYSYIGWDTDPNAIVQNNTTAFGPQLKAANYSGTYPISGTAADCVAEGTTLTTAAMNYAVQVMGMTAAINHGDSNGSLAYAYKSLSGLLPTCTNQTDAATLQSNGYNFYGGWATRSAGDNFGYPGTVSGPFGFMFRYINQIWLNNSLQSALLAYARTVRSMPYNAPSYETMANSLSDVINTAIDFGAIRSGVILSASERIGVNSAAGINIADTLQNVGWYLQIKDPGATARSTGASTINTFWYTDGGSVIAITLASIDVI